jgi:23S rRNA G2069 N7-methylase RlmK/C1962 C5-methylase RlmI
MRDLINRITKNARELRRWALRRKVSAFRVYDREIPGYPYVFDVYGRWGVVSSLARDPSLDEQLRNHWPQFAEVLELEADRLIWRKRERQRGLRQYQKLSEQPIIDHVAESGLVFEVNLNQYLDVGLFLDHRKTRVVLCDWAQGRLCLNLFCYTGAVSVAMAAGGARRVVSMDMSKTYLDWAKRNFFASGLIDDGRHDFVQQDVVGWLAQPPSGESFDLIFVDPPSFSNSKRMTGTFDVQRDHQWLLERVGQRLHPEGVMIFSNNKKGFALESAVLPGFARCDITHWTHPKDFQRRQAHQCFVFSLSSVSVEDFVRRIKALGPDY